MRRLLFLLSLALNVILILILVWFHGYTRKKIFNMVADFTEAQAQRTQQILEDLESGSEERIEAVKEKLRENIKNSKEAIANWRGSSEADTETQE